MQTGASTSQYRVKFSSDHSLTLTGVFNVKLRKHMLLVIHTVLKGKKCLHALPLWTLFLVGFSTTKFNIIRILFFFFFKIVLAVVGSVHSLSTSFISCVISWLHWPNATHTVNYSKIHPKILGQLKRKPCSYYIRPSLLSARVASG